MSHIDIEKPDTLEGLELCVRCFAVAFRHMLVDNEGIMIRLQPENKKFIVVRDGDQINLLPGDDEEPEDGCMVWVHNEPLQ